MVAYQKHKDKTILKKIQNAFFNNYGLRIFVLRETVESVSQN